METLDTAIDHSVLDSIRSLEVPGGEDLVGQIIDTYLQESAELVAEIAIAAQALDGEGVRANAHSLKSSSGNVGARQVVDLAREIESLGRDGDTDRLSDALVGLEQEHRRAVDELQKLRNDS